MKLSNLRNLAEKDKMGPNPPGGLFNEPWLVYPGYYLPPDQHGPIWAVPDGNYPNGKPRWSPGHPGVWHWPDEWVFNEPTPSDDAIPDIIPGWGIGGSPI